MNDRTNNKINFPEFNSNPLNQNSKKIFSISKLINSNQIINFAKKLENPEICFKDSNTSLLSRSNSWNSLSYKNAFVMFPPKPQNKIKLIIEENEMDSSTTSTSKLDMSNNFNESTATENHNNSSKHSRRRSSKRTSMSSSSERSKNNKENSSPHSKIKKAQSFNKVKAGQTCQPSETEYYSPISASSSLSSCTKNIVNNNIVNPNFNQDPQKQIEKNVLPTNKNKVLSSTINTAKFDKNNRQTNIDKTKDSSADVQHTMSEVEIMKNKNNTQNLIDIKKSLSSKYINDQILDTSNINYDIITPANDNTDHFYTSTDEFIESIECDSTCLSLQHPSKEEETVDTAKQNNKPKIQEAKKDGFKCENNKINTRKSSQAKSKKIDFDKSFAYFDVFSYFSELAYVLLTNFKYWCIFTITSFCFMAFFFTKLFLLIVFSFNNISSTLLSPFKLKFIKKLINFFIFYPVEALENVINVERMETMSKDVKDKLGIKNTNDNQQQSKKRHGLRSEFEANPRIHYEIFIRFIELLETIVHKIASKHMSELKQERGFYTSNLKSILEKKII